MSARTFTITELPDWVKAEDVCSALLTTYHGLCELDPELAVTEAVVPLAEVEDPPATGDPRHDGVNTGFPHPWSPPGDRSYRVVPILVAVRLVDYADAADVAKSLRMEEVSDELGLATEILVVGAKALAP